MRSRAHLFGSVLTFLASLPISAAWAQTAPGHVLGVGPNSPGGSGVFAPGTGAGTPNATGGPTPRGESALKPNAGAGKANGSKSAPMMANGVRKID